MIIEMLCNHIDVVGKLTGIVIKIVNIIFLGPEDEYSIRFADIYFEHYCFAMKVTLCIYFVKNIKPYSIKVDKTFYQFHA